MKVEKKAEEFYQRLIDNFKGEVQYNKRNVQVIDWKHYSDHVAGGNFGG